MKCRSILLAVLLFGSLGVGCSRSDPAANGACSTPGDCSSGETCTSSRCVPADSSDAGPSGGPTDGGDGGATDGGDGGPTDGGALRSCVGLQCKQQPWISCPAGTSTTVTGKVFDPRGDLPLYNVTVYVPNGPLEPFTPGVRCESCAAQVSGSPIAIGLSGSDGAFQLHNVPAGENIPLVVQIGRWRRTVYVPSVAACTTTAIADGVVTLPRNHLEGDIPQIAIATGAADPFQCLLRNLGVSDSEFTIPSKNGRIHYYVSNGMGLTSDTAPTLGALVNDPNTLKKYDMVVLPCEGGENLKSSTQMKNIIDYTTLGGRLLTTHYGYVWIVPAPAPFPLTASWLPDRTQSHNPPDPVNATLNTRFPKGQAFADWLYNVGASTTPGVLSLTQLRNDVTAAKPPISTGWMSAGYSISGTAYTSTPHITFNTPVSTQPDAGAGPQCGRVMFSDFHVTSQALVPNQTTFPEACKLGTLSPQERALAFMFFDLSACVQPDDVAPRACGAMGGACAADADCCSALTCQSDSGQACSDGGSCTCEVARP